jgi:hypothetical protein
VLLRADTPYALEGRAERERTAVADPPGDRAQSGVRLAQRIEQTVQNDLLARLILEISAPSNGMSGQSRASSRRTTRVGSALRSRRLISPRIW